MAPEYLGLFIGEPYEAFMPYCKGNVRDHDLLRDDRTGADVRGKDKGNRDQYTAISEGHGGTEIYRRKIAFSNTAYCINGLPHVTKPGWFRFVWLQGRG